MDTSFLGDFLDDLEAKTRREAEKLRQKAAKKALDILDPYLPPSPKSKLQLKIGQPDIVLKQQIERNRDTFYIQRGWGNEKEAWG